MNFILIILELLSTPTKNILFLEGSSLVIKQFILSTLFNKFIKFLEEHHPNIAIINESIKLIALFDKAKKFKGEFNIIDNIVE